MAEVTAPASLVLELVFCKHCSWQIKPKASRAPERDLPPQQVEVGSHPGFTNHESVPPVTQEAQKAPDLERYVGGYIYLLVFQPMHIIELFSTNTRARHAGADSHLGADHSFSSDLAKL